MISDLFTTRRATGYAAVVVERNIDRYPHGLTYAIPPEMAGLKPGDRVIVPLGRGDAPTPGYVMEVEEEPPAELNPDEIKSIRAVEETEIRLPGTLIELAKWIAGYYCTPLGMVLATMLPGPVKRKVGLVTKRLVDLAPGFEEGPAEGVRLSAKQRHVVDVLRGMTEAERPIEIRDLADRAELGTISPITRLLERKVLTQTLKTSIEASWSRQAVDPFVPEALTEQQTRVVKAIESRMSEGYSAHLIHGVTGSGKTEVYIRLIEAVVARGKTALVLVPEIALTPQTGGRLIGRFPKHRVAVLHSGLTAAQRHQQWSLVAAGKADIVLGARSAVFAPIPEGRLGLVVVDEEHDSSYKQDQLPRYHGRDVAMVRAQMSGCPVVMGSATPALESWHNATARGLSTLHRMPDRVPGATLPRVTIVDFREEMRRHEDRRVHLIGPLLQGAIGRTLADGFQVLLLLNRRGYANYIACPDQQCGWVMTCENCDATLVYHRHRTLPQGGFVRCHHCFEEQKMPTGCPQCGNAIVPFGLGTQRVEEELIGMFPGLLSEDTLLRMDSDTMSSSSHYHDALGRFARGEIRLLVGTQMIAKGLDFPKVRLVGVINADTSINLPDFRAAERTFQLVSQVAGRTGRADTAGRVIVQSFQPDADPIRLAAEHDFEEFARREIGLREAFGLPPATRMARIVVRDADHVEAVTHAKSIAERLRGLAEAGVRVRGPAPCPISRIAGRHRQQIEVLGPTAPAVQRLLAKARSEGLVKADAQTAVDVDPIALL